MDKINITDRDGLTREIEENLWEAWSIFGRGSGCFLHEKEDLLWFETPIPIIPYNGVLRSQLQANVDQRIGSIVEHFSQRKAQFMWIVHPSSSPFDLRGRLQSQGLHDVEPLPEPGKLRPALSYDRFHTREGVDVGPYESQFEAEIEAGLLRELFRGRSEGRSGMAVIREFVLDSFAMGRPLRPNFISRDPN